MLRLAIVFFIVAILAGLLGLPAIAILATGVAQIGFFLFLALCVVFGVLGLLGGAAKAA